MSRQFSRHRTILPAVALMTLGLAASAFAGSAQWDATPASGDWNTAANWTPDTVPNGAPDIATFDQSNTTNISVSSPVQVNSMVFNSGASAFTLSGNPVTISAGITNNSSNLQQINSGLTLGANQTFQAASPAGSGSLQFGSAVGAGDGAINLQSFTLSTSGNNIGINTFNGVISGTGALNVNSPFGGPTVLNGANTFSGGTLLGGGPLHINNAAALGTGPLVIVNSSAIFENSSGAPVTLANNNPLILSGGSPTFFGVNDLSFGTAPVTLSGSAGNNRTININWETTSLTLNGVISDGGSNMGLTKDGSGILVLGGNNTFTHFVRILFGTLSVSNIGNAGNSSNLGTNSTINFGGTPPGGPSILKYTGSGETSDKVLNLAAASGGAVIDQSGSGLLKFTSDLTATGAGSKTFTLQGSTSGTGEIAGAIVNNSATNKTSLVKSGTGTWTLSGTNTYTGVTTVNAGTLLVNGSITSAVTVNGPAPFAAAGGTLGGSGTTGAVTVNNGGTLSPGSSPGVLNVQGNLTLQLGASYLVDLNGAAVGTQYDQTNVTGAVALGGATLSLNLGFNPTAGAMFKIINNDLVDPVTGTFAGLAEGTALSINGQTFVISYTGGDGNDVVLTAVPEPAPLALLLAGSATLIAFRRCRHRP